MKVIFLDIDGVLNHHNFYINRSNQSIYQNYPYSEFDPISVSLLNRIVDETGAKIVLSSDWRFQNDISDIFRKIGLPDIYSTTCDVPRQRKDEINIYLETHRNIENYIILDDISDFYDEQKQHLVQTYAGKDGLNETLTIKAINMLNDIKKPKMLVVKPIAADFSNFTEEDNIDNIAFLRIYLHGTIQSKHPQGDQVCIKNISDFDTYTVRTRFVGDTADREFRQIDFEGEIPCTVIGIDDVGCTAILWKTPTFDNMQNMTIGLVCQNDDEWALESARKKFTVRSAIL